MLIESIYKEAEEKWGMYSQLNQMAEECSELAVAISHLLRNRPEAIDEIIEEMADVEIMIGQLKYSFGEEFIKKLELKKEEKYNLIQERLNK